MHQSLQGATFHVEHITPRSTRGRQRDLANPAWCCPACNLHKSDRIECLIPVAVSAYPSLTPVATVGRSIFVGKPFTWLGKRQ